MLRQIKQEVQNEPIAKTAVLPLIFIIYLFIFFFFENLIVSSSRRRRDIQMSLCLSTPVRKSLI